MYIFFYCMMGNFNDYEQRDLMKNFNISLNIVFSILVQTSCASLNRVHGEIHYKNNISKGQELLDLKKALDEGAINQQEYDVIKETIIKDEYVKSIFKQLDEIDDDDEEEGKKASINIEL